MSELLVRPQTHDPAAPPLLVNRLSVQFNGTAALREVSFTLPAGQRVAIVGPNGAGKTTLLRVIAGAMSPTSGSVEIYGARPGGHVCIAYVPQRSQVDWRQALARVGMDDLQKRQIGELSGGQQQRVFLAQALAQEAELVLLDEPLTGLDLPSQEAIFRLLDELRQQGIPVLVATHDLNLAAERFDRVMLLNRRLIAFGSPREVFTREHLAATYGGHIHMLADSGGMLVLTDTCCEGDEEAA
jgi:ABC-type Mn2+/Zn2+ transport system ATPase subunit